MTSPLVDMFHSSLIILSHFVATDLMKALLWLSLELRTHDDKKQDGFTARLQTASRDRSPNAASPIIHRPTSNAINPNPISP